MAGVLVTDGRLRKSLAVTRSLGRAGIACVVTDVMRHYPAAYSRYAQAVRVASDDPESTVHTWLRILSASGCTALFPMDDEAMTTAVNWQDELQLHTGLLVPPKDSYEIASDKGAVVLAANRVGVSCPATQFTQDIMEFTQTAAHIHYPIVIKPRRSSGSRGIRVAHNKEELISLYNEVHEQYPLPILQEYIEPGERFDVCLLYNRDGQLRASFVQKELRHFPMPRGPSTAQESVLAPELLEQSDQLMRSLHWRGIAEVEWMVNPRTGQAQLMEINTRFWNSVNLAIACGISFPTLLYELATGKDCAPAHEYPLGVRNRSLLPEDSLHWLTAAERHSLDPPFWPPVQPGMHDDLFDRDDRRPVIGLLLQMAIASCSRQTWRQMFLR